MSSPDASTSARNPKAKASTVLLVDDHPMMRAGLAALIDRQPDMRVVGEAGQPAEAFRLINAAAPDVVLTDLTMPGRSGLEFIKDLRALNSELKILVVSMHEETVYAERVLRAGGRGYIMKEAGGEAILGALRLVLAGEIYVSPKMSARILQGISAGKSKSSSSPIQQLTDREFEIFRLIGQGKSTRDIAEQLHLSPKTVDVHRANIKEKLGLHDVTAVIRHAVRWVETQGSGE
jgi:DNA-binding NarL/FixJ family response regulator